MSRHEKAVRVTHQAYQGDKNVEDNPREKQFHVFYFDAEECNQACQNLD